MRSGPKFLICECCCFLAVIPAKDRHDDLKCPFCLKVNCDHGGRFVEVTEDTFCKEVKRIR